MMKLALALILATLSAAAVAQPSCWPIIDRDKAYPTLPIIYRDGVGAGVGWYCKGAEAWSAHWYFGTYAQVGADYHAKANAEVVAALNAADPRAAANAAYARLVTGAIGCDVQPSDALKTLCASVRTELAKYPPPPLPPPPSWVVKPNPLAADRSRPVYAVVGGVQLGASLKLRAAANSPCDCTVKILTTATSFCGVNGRLDHVAACMLAP